MMMTFTMHTSTALAPVILQFTMHVSTALALAVLMLLPTLGQQGGTHSKKSSARLSLG